MEGLVPALQSTVRSIQTTHSHTDRNTHNVATVVPVPLYAVFGSTETRLGRGGCFICVPGNNDYRRSTDFAAHLLCIFTQRQKRPVGGRRTSK